MPDPFITGSTNLDEDKVHMIEFPFVCKSFTVINTNSSGDLRLHFQSGSNVAPITVPGDAGAATIATTDDVLAGFHFISIPPGNSSLTMDSKCHRIYISRPNGDGDNATYEVFAELTNISVGSMYELTGSGVTEKA